MLKNSAVFAANEEVIRTGRRWMGQHYPVTWLKSMSFPAVSLGYYEGSIISKNYLFIKRRTTFSSADMIFSKSETA